MKAQLQKLIGTAVLGLALVSHSLPAWAGAVNHTDVTVSSSSAYGTMAGARYSADNQQYIGCQFSNTYGPYIVCSATDKNGKYFLCTGFGPHVAAAAKSITDFSYITLSNASGSCSLSVGNYSAYLK